MNWRNTEERAWLFWLDGRREVHLTLEPVECQVARRFAFGKYPPRCDSSFELGEAFAHLRRRLLHGCIVFFRCRIG
jgi:hypothetical protein